MQIRLDLPFSITLSERFFFSISAKVQISILRVSCIQRDMNRINSCLLTQLAEIKVKVGRLRCTQYYVVCVFLACLIHIYLLL